MGSDQLVGGGVPDSDPEISGTLHVGEQDGEGPLDDRCLVLAQKFPIPGRDDTGMSVEKCPWGQRGRDYCILSIRAPNTIGAWNLS